MLRLSPTRLEDLDCPWRFRARHFNEARGNTLGPGFGLGLLCHAVAADYATHLISRHLATDLDALARIQVKVWDCRIEHLPESVYQEFIELTNRLRDWLPDPETLVGAEKEIRRRLDWSEAENLAEVAWIGRLDVLSIVGTGADRVVKIHDWTTGALGGEHEARKVLQMQFYGLLAHHDTMCNRIEATIHSLRTGATKTIEMDEVDLLLIRARLEQIRSRVERMMETPDDEKVWAPIPGALCAGCWFECPAIVQARGFTAPMRIDTAEHAQAVLGAIVLLDEHRRRLLKPLRAWTSQAGRVEQNGVVASLVASRAMSFETDIVGDLLEANHIDPYEVMKVDRKRLARIVEDRDLLMQIEATATIRTSERFTIHKATEVAGEGDE